MVKTPLLRAVRSKRLLSLAELAAKSGVTKSTILRMEQGEESRGQTVRRLAEALGVEPAELMGEGD